MTTPLQQKIKITGQATARPNVCKFVVDHPIYPGRTVNCRNREMAEGSPLLEALFDIEGIEQIMLSGNVLTIDKSSEEPWASLGKKIGNTIRKTIESGVMLLSEELAEAGQSFRTDDDSMAKRIKVLLDDIVNPALASHGGFVELERVEDRDVYLRMGGGCQGCGAAAMTLQMSIERTLRSELPEINKIIDATDHASGLNPYYS